MKRFTPYIVLCALTAIAVSGAATFMQSTHKDASPVSRENQEVHISVDKAIADDGTSGGEELPDTASSRPRRSVSGAETAVDAGLPDLPDAEGFVPVTPTGLNAPDPAAGITLIAPPAANSRGSASLSYPILLPPSRNGIAPSLGVEYDSDLADGWLGEGWNIPVPSITVDTRWGVPLYDPEYETETYLLDGVMLAECNGATPRVAHRGERRARSSGSVAFQTRRGGDFAKIIRKGSTPSNYIWEVTDKNGRTYIYGGSGYELRGNVGGTPVVAEWKLQKVVEPHGDWCKYYYRPLEVTLSNGIKSREIYLAEIRVGNLEKGETPHTKVLFRIGNRKNSISFNSRYGFVTSRTQNLAQIDVIFRNAMLRKYAFVYDVYESRKFGKTLLSSILQLDDTGKEVARHDFKYDNPALFRDRLTIEGMSSISESKGLSAGGSLYTGVGMVDGSPTTSNTVGLSVSYSHDSGEGESTLADLDGDGVADRIYMDSGKMKYRRGTLSGNALKFGQEREILTVDGANFGKYESGSVNSFSLGAQGRSGIDPFSVAGGTVWNYGSAVSGTYFIDYNGDGLTDIAKDGTVWFNRLVTGPDQSVTPVFGRNSSGTDAPVSGGGSIDGSFIAEDQADIDSMVRHSPMVDAVRVWRAPRAGTVTVSGIARSRRPDVPETSGAGLSETASEDYDGIQVSLQKNGTVIQDKAVSKLGLLVPVSAAGVHVDKGDLLMFRLRCGKNVYASGEGKAADWSPTVRYTSFDDGTPVTDQALPGGYSPVVYKASEGVYANGGGACVAIPSEYRSMRLHAVVSKKTTGDSIRLRVTEFPCSVQNGADIRELLSAGLPWKEGNLSRNVNITDRRLTKPMAFQAVLSTPSSVDWNSVSARIWLECVANDDSTYVFPLIPSLEGFEEPVSFPEKFTVPSILGQLRDPLDSLGVSPLLDIGGGGGVSVTQPSYSVRANPRVRLSAAAPADIDVHYTIRSTDSLVASGTVRVLKGKTTGQAEVSVGKRDLESFDVWTEFFADSVGLISEVFTSWNSGNQPLSLPEKVPAGLNVRVRDARFGILRRGWGAFAFRADSNLYDLPISMESIEMPSEENDFNRMEWHYLPMASDASLSRMQGPREGVYVDGTGMGTARLTVQKIRDRGLFPAVPLSADGADGSDGSGAKAVGMRQTYSGSSIFAGSGIGLGDFGQSVTVQQGTSCSTTQRVMIDLNGDGYPDIAGDKAIQYSDHLGRPSRTVSQEEFSEHRSVESSSFGLGGTTSVQMPAGSFLRDRFGFLARQSDAAHANASAAVNVAGESQKTYTTKGWADVNGDGLPDKVTYEISSYYLNLGNSFSSVPTPLGQSISDISSTSTIDGGVGGSFTYGNGSFAGGVNTTVKEGRAESAFVDLNGDGLPDIMGFSGNSLNVMYSLGDRFGDMVRCPGPGILSESEATAVGGNVAFTVAFPTPLGIKIAVNPGVAVSRTTDRRTASLTDINGDGCPDVVWKYASGGMTALLSQVWKANLLVSVVNSFGGSFDISYSRSEPSCGLPGGKTVMSGLSVDDGISGSGPGLRSRFIYQGGRRYRREREFYGFGKVTECQLDSGTNGATLRSVVREFDVSGYYSQGNLLSESVLDAANREMSKTVNMYYTYVLSPAGKGWSFAERPGYGSDSGSAWTPLRFTEGRLYDQTGRYVPLTQEFLAYCVTPGSFGEVRETKFSSKGTLVQGGAGACDLIRIYSYEYNNLYMSGLVSSVTVREGSNRDLAFTRFSYSFGKEPCKPVSVTKYNGSSGAPVTDFGYDSHGNVIRKRMPADNNGQRMSYGYVYDTELNMYVTKVTDTLGYTAEVSEYDFRYGIPLVSKDINGYIHRTRTDSLGRIVSVLEPSEADIPKQYTDTVIYNCRAGMDGTARKIKHPAYAVAKYYDEPNRKGADGRAEDHYIHVVALADGFGRTVQVLKEGMVTEPDTSGNPVKRHVWIASGRVVYDPLGRPAESYYPVTLPFDTGKRYQVSDTAREKPFRTVYDALDRVVKSVLPDGSVTSTAYCLDQSGNAALATVTDALGNRSATLTDGNGNTLASVRYSGSGESIRTVFEYDGLGRMTRVTDADGNVTESEYDLGGRRISVSHPASGLTAFEYDPLGNMVSRQTPRLREMGKKSYTAMSSTVSSRLRILPRTGSRSIPTT